MKTLIVLVAVFISSVCFTQAPKSDSIPYFKEYDSNELGIVVPLNSDLTAVATFISLVESKYKVDGFNITVLGWNENTPFISDVYIDYTIIGTESVGTLIPLSMVHELYKRKLLETELKRIFTGWL